MNAIQIQLLDAAKRVAAVAGREATASFNVRSDGDVYWAVYCRECGVGNTLDEALEKFAEKLDAERQLIKSEAVRLGLIKS